MRPRGVTAKTMEVEPMAVLGPKHPANRRSGELIRHGSSTVLHALHGPTPRGLASVRHCATSSRRGARSRDMLGPGRSVPGRLAARRHDSGGPPDASCRARARREGGPAAGAGRRGRGRGRRCLASLLSSTDNEGAGFPAPVVVAYVELLRKCSRNGHSRGSSRPPRPR
jgi:hypothetical protein